MVQAAPLVTDDRTFAVVAQWATPLLEWQFSCAAMWEVASALWLPSAVLEDSRAVVVHVDAFLKGVVFLLSAYLLSGEVLGERDTSLAGNEASCSGWASWSSWVCCSSLVRCWSRRDRQCPHAPLVPCSRLFCDLSLSQFVFVWLCCAL